MIQKYYMKHQQSYHRLITARYVVERKARSSLSTCPLSDWGAGTMFLRASEESPLVLLDNFRVATCRH